MYVVGPVIGYALIMYLKFDKEEVHYGESVDERE